MIAREERDCKRVDIIAPTLVQVMWPSLRHSVVHGVATDIGPGGMFIVSENPVERDDLVAVNVDLVEFGEHVIESGKVVRSDETGFAVKFLYRCDRMDMVRPV
jgi:hypothetical protein